MLSAFKNVLVLAPHTDDGELGAGSTINRLIEEGSKVTYAAFRDQRYYDFSSTACRAAFLAGNQDARNAISITVASTSTKSNACSLTG